jgi:small VCP/p97-interacting protein
LTRKQAHKGRNKNLIKLNHTIQETKRRQMAEAAERRRQQEESRGVKNPESVRRMQARALENERLEQQQARSGEPTLKWSQD